MVKSLFAFFQILRTSRIFRCLSNIHVSTRDKVEDCGLLMTIEKWSKLEDEHAKLATDLYAKWRKCMRRIPLKEKSAEPEKSEKEGEKSLAKPPPLQQMAPIKRLKDESAPRPKRKREEEIDPKVG